jgi:hypothetical protein
MASLLAPAPIPPTGLVGIARLAASAGHAAAPGRQPAPLVSGRALEELGIQMIPAYSPQARAEEASYPIPRNGQ